jgi:hypothetical protein
MQKLVHAATARTRAPLNTQARRVRFMPTLQIRKMWRERQCQNPQPANRAPTSYSQLTSHSFALLVNVIVQISQDSAASTPTVISPDAEIRAEGAGASPDDDGCSLVGVVIVLPETTACAVEKH